jgi:hypothetical protein
MHTTCGRPRRPKGPTYSTFGSVFWRNVAQIATVGFVGGFREDDAIGTQEGLAGFRRKLRACRVLRNSGSVNGIEPMTRSAVKLLAQSNAARLRVNRRLVPADTPPGGGLGPFFDGACDKSRTYPG